MKFAPRPYQDRMRRIPGYPGYLVSKKGMIIGVRGRVMSPSMSSDGYLRVCTRIGRTRFTAVHRLVALAFLGRARRTAVVHHKDGDRMNNTAGNLEWVGRKLHISRHRKARRLSKAIIAKVRKSIAKIGMPNTARKMHLKYHQVYKVACGRW